MVYKWGTVLDALFNSSQGSGGRETPDARCSAIFRVERWNRSVSCFNFKFKMFFVNVIYTFESFVCAIACAKRKPKRYVCALRPTPCQVPTIFPHTTEMTQCASGIPNSLSGAYTVLNRLSQFSHHLGTGTTN